MADDEAWERAIATTLKKSTSTSQPKTLTLDGAVKSTSGRLPSPSLLERFASSLEDLSIAGARISSLAGFPRLPSLHRLSLPDNRLASAEGLSGLTALRELDLSNNRLGAIDDLKPLAELKLEALDLYECPVSKIEGYRKKVFAMLPGLKFLDGVDADGNERAESDDDEEDDEEEDGEEEGEEDDEEDGEDGEEADEEDDAEEGEEDEVRC